MLWRGKHDILDEHDRHVEATNIDNSFGTFFFLTVISTSNKTYHTSSFKSSVELKARLQKNVGMKKMFNKFYPHGKLGDSPNAP